MRAHNEILLSQAEANKNTLMVLEKELADGGASADSAQKGKKEELDKKINQTLAQRRASKRKKPDNPAL